MLAQLTLRSNMIRMQECHSNFKCLCLQELQYVAQVALPALNSSRHMFYNASAVTFSDVQARSPGAAPLSAGAPAPSADPGSLTTGEAEEVMFEAIAEFNANVSFGGLGRAKLDVQDSSVSVLMSLLPQQLQPGGFPLVKFMIIIVDFALVSSCLNAEYFDSVVYLD